MRLGLPAEPRARVHLQSGAVVDADIGELGRWASEQSNPGNARRVAYVQVLLPHPLLDAGLVLLDTPGLGGLLGAHGTMTLNALDESDARSCSSSVPPRPRPTTSWRSSTARGGA